MKNPLMLFPKSGQLAPSRFDDPHFDPFAGERGAFVARSLDGLTDAIAERINGGWRFWLVSTSDGETIHTEDLCAF